MTDIKHDSESEKDQADIRFRTEHLTAFCESVKSVSAKYDTDDAGGKRCQSFGNGLPDVTPAVLPEGRVKRSEVFELASNPEVNVPTVCAAIMAWGGMRLDHRDLLFKSSGREWLKVAQDIRCGAIDRMKTYGRLKELRHQGRLKGAGPAYFTKLIYFLTPRHGAVLKAGYIMDQWAGCSVNLLIGREVVLMNVTKTWKRQEGPPVPAYEFTVANENTGANYEAFCTAVDCLASRCSINADQVDRALVSTGGKNPESWRKYVRHHRR